MKRFLLSATTIATLLALSLGTARGAGPTTPDSASAPSMSMESAMSMSASSAHPTIAGKLGGGAGHLKQSVGPTKASAAWVRWLPANLPAAGYLTLLNTGKAAIDLTSADSPDYQQVMLHQSVSNGSTDRMIMVPKLTIPAGGSVQIAPGGYHLMLISATRKVAPGDTVRVNLHFSDGSSLEVPMPVRPPTGAN